MERRLSAIFAADMVGYSRLVEADEIGTLQRQKTHRKELIDPAFEQFKGRIVKEMGDGILVEFPSVVDAVQCAVKIQRGMPEREDDVTENRRIAYRIGINLGDIIVEGDDIHGDGVNIAARLEQLAEPGGICISGTAYDHMRSTVEVGYKSLGEVQVKNIERPIRAYKVLTEPEKAGSLARKSQRSPDRRYWAAIGLILLMVVGASGLWWLQQSRSERDDPAEYALGSPDQPSIAVLPFENISGDEREDYFGDGMAEDIITDLAKISGLFVIARNSSFAQNERNGDIKEVGQKLGARYILEGSVRRSGNQVRVNAQLVDTLTGGNLWADRIDGETSDVFKLQDQVTRQIVDALEIELTSDEQLRRSSEKQVNPEAYDLYLRGLRLHATFKESDLPKMLQLYGHAAKLDPDFAEAHARVANIAYDIARSDKPWIMPQPKALELTRIHLAKALELDNDNVTALSTKAHQELELGHAEEAEKIIERAIAISPSDISTVVRRAYILSRIGRYEDAAATADLAQLLEPDPTAAQLMTLSNVYFHARQYEKSVELGEKAKKLGIRPIWALETLIANYARLDMRQELDEAMAEFLEAWPSVNLRFYRNLFEYFRPQATLDQWIESLRLAGIPEWPAGITPDSGKMLTVNEIDSIFGTDKQRIGTTLEGWPFRSVSNPDNSGIVELQLANGQQVRFTQKFTRLIMAQDGAKVRELCIRDPDRNMGRERCMLALRNADGSSASRDEFMTVSDNTITRFSVFPREEQIDWTKPNGARAISP